MHLPQRNTNATAPNKQAVVSISRSGVIKVKYNRTLIFTGYLSSNGKTTGRSFLLNSSETVGANDAITQQIYIQLANQPGKLSLKGTIFGSDQSFAAQSMRPNSGFQFIRNQLGRSSNLLNNAVYDRYRDWALSGAQSTRIWPQGAKQKVYKWGFETHGLDSIILTFQPAYYRKHKNIHYFQPWTYKPWQGSITGWCSWWAYRDAVTAKDVEKVSKVFSDNLKDYGYKYIQIDDGYQSGSTGTLESWLKTNSKFPAGLGALSNQIKGYGLDPALWVNVHFSDPETLAKHPNWFIQDAPGKPHKGPWIDYAMNPASKEAVANIIEPHFYSLRSQGWDYIKIDALRHFLYDAMYPSREELAKQGETPEHLLRLYLSIARKALGPQTYILSCWGVLPEVVGYANGCRLGTDGYGPATLQQYSSWNNVVWKNDPDHCDLEPLNDKGQPQSGSEKIRATLASVASAQLLMSDHPEVYENPVALDAARRVSPVLFLRPGQLYDFDPSKTDNLILGLRNQNGGSQPGPIDADQFGKVCPWWAMDINEPYESWMVLTEMNWEKTALPRQTIHFSDLGLDSRFQYLVFEGWSNTFLGIHHGTFSVPLLESQGVRCFAIRKLLPRPQLVSTNRHISQGAVDIGSMQWHKKSLELSGTVNLVWGFPYEMVFHLPQGYAIKTAEVGGEQTKLRRTQDGLETLRITSSITSKVHWVLKFSDTH